MTDKLAEPSSATAQANTAARDDQSSRDPLGLPAGSVRALLTLVLVGFVVVQLKRGVPLRIVWTETLMIVLAHYFTSRRLINLSPEAQKRLQAEGALRSEEHPLFLPRHSIRFLIVAAFGGLAWYLYEHGRLFEPQAISTLSTVGAYLLGNISSGIWRWLMRNRDPQLPRWWMDLKASVTLTVVAIAIANEFVGLPAWLPIQREHLENATLGLILFYFGSR